MVAVTGGFLLDTNVISELVRPLPDRSVVDWLESIPEDVLFISVITLGEIRRGIDLLDEHSAKRATLQGWLDHDVRLRFAGRMLALDPGVAERWGQLEARMKRRGITLPTVDAQLAATALHYGLTMVTRNAAQIEPAGVPVFNPWSAGRG